MDRNSPINGRWRALRTAVPLAAGLHLLAAPALAAEGGTTMDIYGFAMLDTGYQFNQNDPDWYDVVRPTKLPSYEDEFGVDGNWFAGVRQSRFGVKTNTPTEMGNLYTVFEFELFGTGVDAGQTTLRLRHAYGELGAFGAGQTWSAFMDIDIFPNSVEYWGPNGMVFYRNVQVRWMPIKGDTRMIIALERPGASADGGDYSDFIALQGVKPHFPLPDLTAQYRMATGFGYVQLAGILRKIEWEDTVSGGPDLSGSTVGWGLNLTSNIKIGRSTLRLGVVYGEGIQNYMNDATVDVGAVFNPGNTSNPIDGEAIPMLGISAFIDTNWNERMSTTIGYSMLDTDPSSGMSADAFKFGDYALANVMFYPVKNVMFGPEIQYGGRKNNTDGFNSDDFRIQFSVKYNFGHTFNIGGN